MSTFNEDNRKLAVTDYRKIIEEWAYVASEYSHKKQHAACVI